MVTIQGDNEQFYFYLNFAKPLILNLPDTNDRLKAAAWVRKLKDDASDDSTLRTNYLKLLLFVLQRRKLFGPFAVVPDDTQPLKPLSNEIDLEDIAKSFVDVHKKVLKETLLRSGRGEWPPYNVACSSNLTEYAASQIIPNFGIQVYFAISKDPIQAWDRVEKAIFPVGENIEGVKQESILPVTVSPNISSFVSKEQAAEPTSPRRSLKESLSKTGEKGDELDLRPEKEEKPSPESDPFGVEAEISPTWGSNLAKVNEAQSSSKQSFEGAESEDEFDFEVSERDMLDVDDDIDLNEFTGISDMEDSFDTPPRAPSPAPSLPYKTPPIPGPQLPSPAPSLPYMTPPQISSPTPSLPYRTPPQIPSPAASIPYRTPSPSRPQTPFSYVSDGQILDLDSSVELAENMSFDDYVESPQSIPRPRTPPRMYEFPESPELPALRIPLHAPTPVCKSPCGILRKSPTTPVERESEDEDEEFKRLEAEVYSPKLQKTPVQKLVSPKVKSPARTPEYMHRMKELEEQLTVLSPVGKKTKQMSPAQQISSTIQGVVQDIHDNEPTIDAIHDAVEAFETSGEGLGGDSFIAPEYKGFKWLEDLPPGPGMPTDEQQDPALFESFGWWTDDPEEIFTYLPPTPRYYGPPDPFAAERERWADVPLTPPIFSHDPKIREGPGARRLYGIEEFGMESFEEPVWTSGEQYLKHMEDLVPFRDPRQEDRRSIDISQYPCSPQLTRQVTDIRGAQEEEGFFDIEQAPYDDLELSFHETDFQPMSRPDAIMAAIEHGPKYIGLPPSPPLPPPEDRVYHDEAMADVEFLAKTPPKFIFEPQLTSTPPEYDINPKLKAEDFDESISKYVEDEMKLLESNIPVTTPIRSPSPKRQKRFLGDDTLPGIPDIEVDAYGPGSPELLKTPPRFVPQIPKSLDHWDIEIGEMRPVSPMKPGYVGISEEERLAKTMMRKNELMKIYGEQFASPVLVESPEQAPHLIDEPIQDNVELSPIQPDKLPPSGWSWQTPPTCQSRSYVSREVKTPTGVSPVKVFTEDVSMYFESPPPEMYSSPLFYPTAARQLEFSPSPERSPQFVIPSIPPTEYEEITEEASPELYVSPKRPETPELLRRMAELERHHFGQELLTPPAKKTPPCIPGSPPTPQHEREKWRKQLDIHESDPDNYWRRSWEVRSKPGKSQTVRRYVLGPKLRAIPDVSEPSAPPTQTRLDILEREKMNVRKNKILEEIRKDMLKIQAPKPEERVSAKKYKYDDPATKEQLRQDIRKHLEEQFKSPPRMPSPVPIEHPFDSSIAEEPCLSPLMPEKLKPPNWDWQTPPKFKDTEFVSHEVKTPTGISPVKKFTEDDIMYLESPPREFLSPTSPVSPSSAVRGLQFTPPCGFSVPPSPIKSPGGRPLIETWKYEDIQDDIDMEQMLPQNEIDLEDEPEFYASPPPPPLKTSIEEKPPCSPCGTKSRPISPATPEEKRRMWKESLKDHELQKYSKKHWIVRPKPGRPTRVKRVPIQPHLKSISDEAERQEEKKAMKEKRSQEIAQRIKREFASPPRVPSPRTPPHLIDEPISDAICSPQITAKRLPPPNWNWATPPKYKTPEYIPRVVSSPSTVSPVKVFSDDVSMYYESPPHDLYTEELSPDRELFERGQNEMDIEQLYSGEFEEIDTEESPEFVLTPPKVQTPEKIDREEYPRVQSTEKIDKEEPPELVVTPPKVQTPKKPEQEVVITSTEDYAQSIEDRIAALESKLFAKEEEEALTPVQQPPAAFRSPLTPPTPEEERFQWKQSIKRHIPGRHDYQKHQFKVLPKPGKATFIRRFAPLPRLKKVDDSEDPTPSPPPLSRAELIEKERESVLNRQMYIRAQKQAMLDIIEMQSLKLGLNPPKQYLSYDDPRAKAQRDRLAKDIKERVQTQFKSPPRMPSPEPIAHPFDEPIPEMPVTPISARKMAPPNWSWQSPPELQPKPRVVREIVTPTGISPIRHYEPDSLYYESPPLAGFLPDDSIAPSRISGSPMRSPDGRILASPLRSPDGRLLTSPLRSPDGHPLTSTLLEPVEDEIDLAEAYPYEVENIGEEAAPQLFSSPPKTPRHMRERYKLMARLGLLPTSPKSMAAAELRDLEFEVLVKKRTPPLPSPTPVCEGTPPTPEHMRKIWQQELALRSPVQLPKKTWVVKPKPGKPYRVTRSKKPDLPSVTEKYVEWSPEVPYATPSPVKTPQQAPLKWEWQTPSPKTLKTTRIKPIEQDEERAFRFTPPDSITTPTREILDESLPYFIASPRTPPDTSPIDVCSPSTPCSGSPHFYTISDEDSPCRSPQLSPMLSPGGRPVWVDRTRGDEIDYASMLPHQFELFDDEAPPDEFTDFEMLPPTPPVMPPPPKPYIHQMRLTPRTRPKPDATVFSPESTPVRGYQEYQTPSPTRAPQAFKTPPRHLKMQTPESARAPYELFPEAVRFEPKRTTPVAAPPSEVQYKTPCRRPPEQRQPGKRPKIDREAPRKRLVFDEAEMDYEQEMIQDLQQTIESRSPCYKDVEYESPPRDAFPPDDDDLLSVYSDVDYEPTDFMLYEDQEAEEYDVAVPFAGQRDYFVDDTSPIRTVDEIPEEERDFKWMGCGRRC